VVPANIMRSMRKGASSSRRVDFFAKIQRKERVQGVFEEEGGVGEVVRVGDRGTSLR